MASITSCNNSQEVAQNPFFEEWTTPFGVPPFDKIEAEDYTPALEKAMEIHNEEIEAIVTSPEVPSFENTILAYDNSGKKLTDIYSVFSLVEAADTNEKLQHINEEMSPKLAAHSDRIALNDGLFKRVKYVYDNRAQERLSAEQSRLLQKTYNSFVRSGALLEGEKKERLQAINEELSSLGIQFSNNVLAENKDFTLELDVDQLDGLPASLKSAAKNKAIELGVKDKWVFTLQASSWIPFLTYSSNRELREQLYKGYIMRGNNDNEVDNKEIINSMIALRLEKAQLLGFDSYSEYVTSDQMAKSTKAAYSLLDKIWTPALNRSKEELKMMESLLARDDSEAKFESWDWWYYAEKLRKQNYNLDEEMLRPYFSLDGVQTGIFLLANRLYGITFRPIAVPHYNEECSAYEVIDADNSHIGVLYFDLHTRSSKSQGAWCGNFREQRYEDGERLSPIVSITCNFPQQSGSTPVLLTIDETETLFHEFGHALHFLFHDVKYRGLSEVEGDFVELPSQIMENWALEPEFLKQYAFHYRTHNVISDELIKKIQNSSLFNQGFSTTELAAAALSDLDIHSIESYSPIDVNAFEKESLTTKRGLISQIEPRYHYTYFNHIFAGGYSSGYYFYLWAEVLDKDAFAAFKESGDLFNKEIANRFRREVLEKGGSLDGMELYHNFRGAAPSQDAMLKGRGLK